MCARMCVHAPQQGGREEKRCGHRISVCAMAARSVQHHLDR